MAQAELWMDEAGDMPGADGAYRIGVSAAWLEGLGESIVSLELSPPGTSFGAGETFGFAHTPTRTFDLRAPQTLRIRETNGEALSDPRLIELAPYSRGWLVAVERPAPES